MASLCAPPTTPCMNITEFCLKWLVSAWSLTNNVFIVFFFLGILEDMSFFGTTDIPVFWLLVTSPLNFKARGVLFLLIWVPILVRLDCLSHSITMEVWKPVRWKTAKIHWNEPTREYSWDSHIPWDSPLVWHLLTEPFSSAYRRVSIDGDLSCQR